MVRSFKAVVLLGVSLISSTSVHALPVSEPAAAPAPAPLDTSNINPIHEYFTTVAKHIQTIQHNAKVAPAICDLAKLVMPLITPALPSVGDGLAVKHVAVGRGLQNYTCADSTANSVPKSIGAVASLYNATCTGALYPDLLGMMSSVALKFPIPSPSGDAQSSRLALPELLLSGHHYFADATTAVMDLDAAPQRQYGVFFGNKVGSSPAPDTAPKGSPPQGAKPNSPAYGAVPWLKLTQKQGDTSQGIKEVYRVNTAGGNPPPTCQDMPSAFSVDYAAEYWFFN